MAVGFSSFMKTSQSVQTVPLSTIRDSGKNWLRDKRSQQVKNVFFFSSSTGALIRTLEISDKKLDDLARVG